MCEDDICVSLLLGIHESREAEISHLGFELVRDEDIGRLAGRKVREDAGLKASSWRYRQASRHGGRQTSREDWKAGG